MISGDLRHRITLLHETATIDARGRTIHTWTEAANVAAAIADVSSKDFYAAYAAGCADTVTFTIRWRDDVTTKWRVQHRKTVYEIVEVDHLGYKRDFLRLRCKALAGSSSSPI